MFSVFDRVRCLICRKTFEAAPGLSNTAEHYRNTGGCFVLFAMMQQDSPILVYSSTDSSLDEAAAQVFACCLTAVQDGNPDKPCSLNMVAADV